MGLRRALLLASLWRARTDEDLSWGSLEQQADDDFVPTLSASNVTAYLMMPYAHCVDCAEGTGSWCAGATALYEAAVEPAETICVGHTLEEWEAAVAAVSAKHDDPADVLFVPFWIRSDWMQSFAGPLKNGSTAVLVGGAANGVMMYPELDYGPAPPANHSYDAKLFMVGPNNYEGSYAQAREFCRITESEDKRHVVMTTVALHERSKAFADGVAAFCGDRGHVLYAFDHSGDPSIVFGSQDDVYELYAAHFLERPEISVVLTNDATHAKAATLAAADFREGGTFGLHLSTNSFWNDGAPLGDNVFANMNVIYQSPGEGMLFVVERLVRLAKAKSPILGRLENRFIKYSPKLELPDMATSIMDEILPAYTASVAPAYPTVARVWLNNIAVTQVTPTEAFFFEVVADLSLSWVDARLSYSPSQLNESMVYAAADIWHPSLSFVGAYDVAELRSTPCEVSCDGTVRWTRTFRVSSVCDSALEMFPFDAHDCHLRIHADVPVSQLELVVEQMHVGFSGHNYELSTSVGARGATSYGRALQLFNFHFDHKPFAYYIKLVFPVALLNFAGFLGFWMDSASDSVALGITTVLCTLALRETVEFPDAFYLTWIEIFVMINITVQTICLVLAIFKYHKKTEYLIGKNMYSHPLARMKSVISASLGNERTTAARASLVARASKRASQAAASGRDSGDDDEKDEGGTDHELVAVDVADEAPPSPSRSSRGGSPPLPDEAPETLSARAPSTRKMLGSLTQSASMHLLGTPAEDDGELEVYHDYPTDLVGRYIVIPSYILIFFIFTYNEGELVKPILET